MTVNGLRGLPRVLGHAVVILEVFIRKPDTPVRQHVEAHHIEWRPSQFCRNSILLAELLVGVKDQTRHNHSVNSSNQGNEFVSASCACCRENRRRSPKKLRSAYTAE